MITRSRRSLARFNSMSYYCATGNLPMCKWLFSHGAAEDVTVESGGELDEDGGVEAVKTPLYWACFAEQMDADDFITGPIAPRHLAVVRWLVEETEAAADLERETGYIGESPFTAACWMGHLVIAQYLYGAGATSHVNGIGNEQTPLMQACANDFDHDGLPLCKWLLDVGADPEKSDRRGNTALTMSCSQGCADEAHKLATVQWLLAVCSDDNFVTAAEKDGRTPIWRSCCYAQLPILSQFLVLKGGLNDPKSGHVTLNRVLRDLIPSSEDSSDDIPPVVLRALIPWAQRLVADHRTFFQTAVMGAHDRAATAAAAAAAASVKRRRSPRLRKKRCLLPMLCSEVLVLVADFAGVTRGRELRNVRELVGFMEQFSFDANLAVKMRCDTHNALCWMFSYTQQNLPEKIQEVLDEVEGINASDGNSVGQTALHIACIWGNWEAVACLIANHADVNRANYFSGGRPLHMTAITVAPGHDLDGRKKCAELLLAAGADLSATDSNGRTALDLAAPGAFDVPEMASLYQKHAAAAAAAGATPAAYD